MHIRFDSRTVIVTGAAHGFGRAIALSFANLGARVVACDVRFFASEQAGWITGPDAVDRRRPLSAQ